jgi:hypothetical protein
MASAPQCDLEVGSEHADLVALGLDEHVGKNRNRVLALHDALEKLQFSQKLILPDNKFHRLCGDLKRSGRSAVDGS